MISVDFSQPSTWRGIAMAGAGFAGLWYLLPEINAIYEAVTNEQLQFHGKKIETLAMAIGLAGQTISGLVGVLFNDKP